MVAVRIVFSVQGEESASTAELSSIHVAETLLRKIGYTHLTGMVWWQADRRAEITFDVPWLQWVSLIKQREYDLIICTNCACIICNAECGECISNSDRDLNGEACPESEAIAKRWPGSTWSLSVGEDADTGFRADWCGACGEHIATDEWMTATAWRR